MKIYFFQCDKCKTWRYALTTRTYAKCLRCGHNINIKNIKKVWYDTTVSKAPLILKELKKVEWEEKMNNNKNNKEQYLTKNELERLERYYIEFCKTCPYVSSIKIAKRYREKYMPKLHTQPILLHAVEKSLSIRVSRLLTKGLENKYLTKFSKKTYEVDHKKLNKYLENLEK